MTPSALSRSTLRALWVYIAAYAVWAWYMWQGVVERGVLNDLLFAPMYLGAGYMLAAARKAPQATPRLRRGLRLLSLVWFLAALAFSLWALLERVAFAPLNLLAWALYSLYYPLTVAGLWYLIVWPEREVARIRVAIDALIVMVAAVTLQWYHILRYPAVAPAREDVLSHLRLLFPLELLMAAGAAVLLHRPPEHGGNWVKPLGVGIFVATGADFIFEYSKLVPGSTAGPVGDVILSIGMGLVATGGFRLAHSGSAPATGNAQSGPVALTLVPYLAIAIVGLLLLKEYVDKRLPVPIVGLIGGGTALMVLLVARLLVAAREVSLEATARASQDARFRSLVQRSSDAILVVDALGIIRYASPAFARMAGLPGDDASGRALSEFTGADAIARLFGAGNTSTSQPERWPLRAGPGDRTVEAVATDLRLDTEVRGVVVNLRDVTERLQLEEQLRQSQKLEIVGRVSSSVAHDFNNVLSVVLGNASLARLRGDTAEEWDAVASAAERGAALARQLLAFSHAAPHNPRVLDLNAEVQRMEKTLLAVLPRSIELTMVPSSRPLPVRLDATQAERVVLNLALNARDAMPAGGRLTIAVREEPRTEDDGASDTPWVCVLVTDTGVGMDSATLARAFDPFFTTKSLGVGTGLGLSTARQLMTDAGGTVDIGSQPGHGTVVTLRFPMAAEAIDVPGEVVSPRAAPSGTARVLVVEDESAARLVLVRYLGALGFQVLQARDGVEAIELLEAQRWDVDAVITDLIMPRMNGDALTRRIREHAPALPVLCMSGTPGLAEGGDAPWPADHILQKPLTLDVVAHRVQAVVRQPPAARAAS